MLSLLRSTTALGQLRRVGAAPPRPPTAISRFHVNGHGPHVRAFGSSSSPTTTDPLGDGPRRGALPRGPLGGLLSARPVPGVSPLLLATSPMSRRRLGLVTFSPSQGLQLRGFARRASRNPWEQGPWQFGPSGSGSMLDTIKTGALLAVGAGAVMAVASVGMGFIVFGAAGYGVYALYRRFFGPYRSRGFGHDSFGSVNADIDRIFSERTKRGAPQSARDIDSLVEGLPFVVKGLVKTVFSFVGNAMQGSMERAGELRRRTNDYVQSNARVVAQMGSNVRISTPQNWMEYSVNGTGRVEAVFPVLGDGHAQAQVTAKASLASNGEMAFTELKYCNLRTGEIIDLLQDNPTGRRRKVVDAEYHDL